MEEFRDRIEAAFGLVFDEGRREQVEQAFDARRTELGLGAGPYLDRLAEDGAEWEQVAARLTVPESYFFRHADHLRAFVDVAVPERLTAHPAGSLRGDRTLRILSVGCANGEEPYTLAIALLERPDLCSGWKVDILACDINPEALRRAERGIYTNWALRATPPALRERYFEPAGNRHRIRDEARASVHFAEGNVLTLFQPEDAGRFDIIFFRNVLIYFSPEAIRAAISGLAHLLAPEGYLFLGPAETLRGVSDDFVLCHTHETFYYRRKATIAARIPFAPAVARGRQPATAEYLLSGEVPAQGFAPAPEPPFYDTGWMEAIERSSERIRGLQAKQAARPGVPPPVPGPEKPRYFQDDELQRLIGLLGGEQYAAITEAFARLPEHLRMDPDVQLVCAVAHLNSGGIQEAEKVCRNVLTRDSMNGSGHYILALCRDHARDAAGAAEHDRIAIYLDPSFAMPHMHLALVARRGGDTRTARREFENANLLLARESASRLMMFGGGFTREALRDICRRELRGLGAA